MKKLLFLLLLLTCSMQAQIISIPDANFKAKLLSANSSNYTAGVGFYTNSFQHVRIDTNNNGEIEVAEAQLIDFLDVSISATISDLTGIEFFTNIKYLNCSNNNLSSLNLSSLVNLKSLSCAYNQLTALNFYGLQELEHVSCYSNLMTTLDFHDNPLFFDLACGFNPNLTSIILKNGTTQNCSVGFFYCDGFFDIPNLNSICVDESEAECVQNLITSYSGSTAAVDTSCTFPLVNDQFSVDNSVVIAPNPASDNVNINCNDNIQSIQLFDVQGRVLITLIVNDAQSSIDMSNYNNGIYFVKVVTEKGGSIEKIVKR